MVTSKVTETKESKLRTRENCGSTALDLMRLPIFGELESISDKIGRALQARRQSRLPHPGSLALLLEARQNVCEFKQQGGGGHIPSHWKHTNNAA